MPSDTWGDYWQRVRAAVSEGMCLRCLAPLEPAPYHPLVLLGAAVGWCKACRFYWKAGPDGAAGFETGYYLEVQRENYQRFMGYAPDC